MGAIFSSSKPAEPIEADSVASTNPVSPANPVSNPETDNPAALHRPRKRRRIDPHNDVSPAVVPTVKVEPPSTVPSALPVASRASRAPHAQQRAVSFAAVPSLVGAEEKPPPRPLRFKKFRYALFLAYNGEHYHGMQVNPGVVTIEQLLMTALYKANLVSEFTHSQPYKIQLMRAARTDKGVSAAGQCVSVRLELSPDFVRDYSAAIHEVNKFLPHDVRVFGLIRSTPSFNARIHCQRRRYEYIFPLRLLGGPNVPQQTSGEADAPDPRITRFNLLLKQYEGSHCFANFTENLSSSDDASRRFMISVVCLPPFLPPDSGLYYVKVQVLGQSFLLHQIRKMIGLALVAFHGHWPEECIRVALSPNARFPTPKAPAEGLLLDTLFFDENYAHASSPYKGIADSHFSEAKEDFKAQKIYHRIAEKERYDRVLEMWVNKCKSSLQCTREEVMDMYHKFITTDVGQEEQRKALMASLYPIRTDVTSFMDATAESEACNYAEELRKQFENRYGTRATFLIRAPGRVVLIGEHLDYNGFPVISAAMQQGTIVAGCLDNTKELEVQHVDDTTYGTGKMNVNGTLCFDRRDGDVGAVDQQWLAYVSCGVTTFVKDMKGKRHVSGGGRMLISGDLPRAGGLASSSSLVTACVLTAARLNRRRVPREHLASVAAQAERGGAGTRGGSVDHVTSMCAEKGKVLEVSFVPRVTVRTFNWPQGARLFVVDSLTKAEKGRDDGVKQAYNLRVAECRIAAALLARRLGVHLWKTVTTPGQLLFQAAKTDQLDCKNVSMLRVQASVVMNREEVITLQLARDELDVGETEFENRFLAGTTEERFAVGKRMAHVFSEAERVELFANVIGDENMGDTLKMESLGALLNAGQASLRNNYESSVESVDELVRYCLKNGALGSRMTGAGWGGYVVNIVPQDKAHGFVKAAVARVGATSVMEVLPWSGASVFAIHQKYGSSDRGRKRNIDDRAGAE